MLLFLCVFFVKQINCCVICDFLTFLHLVNESLAVEGAGLHGRVAQIPDCSGWIVSVFGIRTWGFQDLGFPGRSGISPNPEPFGMDPVFGIRTSGISGSGGISPNPEPFGIICFRGTNWVSKISGFWGTFGIKNFGIWTKRGFPPIN